MKVGNTKIEEYVDLEFLCKLAVIGKVRLLSNQITVESGRCDGDGLLDFRNLSGMDFPKNCFVETAWARDSIVSITFRFVPIAKKEMRDEKN